MIPRPGKTDAEHLAHVFTTGVKAAGAAAAASDVMGGALTGPFVVVAILMEAAAARCQRIANDPPRDDFQRRAIARRPSVRPASEGDPAVVELGMGVREVCGGLSGVIDAFERQLGALEAREFRYADMRRREVQEFALHASQALQLVAEAAPRLRFPPAAHNRLIRSEDLSIEAQAYLFRSHVLPGRADRVLAPARVSDRELRSFPTRLSETARSFAQFLESWDGRPDDKALAHL